MHASNVWNLYSTIGHICFNLKKDSSKISTYIVVDKDLEDNQKIPVKEIFIEEKH